MTADFWGKACKDLAKSDPIMRKLIRVYGKAPLKSRGNAFETLFRSIVGQQISVKAAQSVWNKTTALVDVTDPQSVLSKEKALLRTAGLSERKVEYVKDLARHFVNREVHPLQWSKMTDEEIIDELIQIRGIGRWTAEMFLIFHVLRPNVFPVDDLGLQKGISVQYKKRYPMSERQLALFRKKFDPWCSVATWYLWRALDPIPVEY